ncbi:MAG: hypothetical protein RLZZ522_368 [Verrucomicrobiota bacterium]
MLSRPLADRSQPPRGEEHLWRGRRPGAQPAEPAPTTRFRGSDLCHDVARRAKSLRQRACGRLCAAAEMAKRGEMAERGGTPVMPGHRQRTEARNGVGSRQAQGFRPPNRGNGCGDVPSRRAVGLRRGFPRRGGSSRGRTPRGCRSWRKRRGCGSRRRRL